MKDQYDRRANQTSFNVGERVWVFMPLKHKGLSKKPAHNYHGPYRIVEKPSPVHYKIKAHENQRVSVYVHVNRLKPYHDPDDRPIGIAKDDPDEPYLSERDLPDDSFSSDPATPEQTVPVDGSSLCSPDHIPEVATGVAKRQSPPHTPESSNTNEGGILLNVHDHAAETDVFNAERILRQRTQNGQEEYLVKWVGYPHRDNTWEPASHILDKRLWNDYYSRIRWKGRRKTQCQASR